MTFGIIDTGAAANDNTGDPARIAFTKTNDNFAEVSADYYKTGGQLILDTSLETFAPVQIVSQSIPTTALANGQLALVGGILYMYDLSRTKWLSLESSTSQHSKNGSADGVTLRWGGDVRNNNSGHKMPFNGTIVYVSAQSSAGNTTKQFNVRVNGVNSFPFSLVGNEYLDTTINVDFSAGDFLSVFTEAAGSASINPAICIWVKWRA